jgi:hypothetical protein
MRDVSACWWDVDDRERAATEEGLMALRAKPVVRRTPTTWLETEDTWRATIGRFSVRVARTPCSVTWEWSAFAKGSLPRALRCKGFREREAAQRDAELTLAEQA